MPICIFSQSKFILVRNKEACYALSPITPGNKVSPYKYNHILELKASYQM